MAAFRKLYLGLAAAAMFAAVASAQTQGSLQCVANASVPPTVRSEGLTELVGDVTLNCTGGNPTAAGVTIPSSNVTVFLNTNITSRVVSTNSGTWSEAILMIDEPHSVANPNVQLLACGDTNTTQASPGVCTVLGTAGGIGATGPYSGAPGHPNVFQARVGIGGNASVSANPNAVTWSGVPFDAPGTSGTRVIRITNVRAYAAGLGVSNTLIPTQITMYISVTGSNQLPINNPTQTVAYVEPGLTSSIVGAGQFQQCTSYNTGIFNNGTGSGKAEFIVSMGEGFQSSFKRKNLATNGSSSTTYPTNDLNQDVPGAVYNTESAFENLGSAYEPSPNPPVGSGVTGNVGIQGAAFPSTYGLNAAGIANAGTRLMLQFAVPVQGVQIYVPTAIRLVSQLTGAATGVAVLTSTNSSGGGGFSAVSNTGGAITTCDSNIGSGTCSSLVVSGVTFVGLAQVSLTNSAGMAVYEVLYSDPFQPESLNVPVAMSYSASVATNLPTPNTQVTVQTSFAPLSTVNTATSGDPIPRFVPDKGPANLFLIYKCSCNLLFPFVTNQLGYDTGVAISNTSLDPFGTAPQSGTVTLNYYCGQTGCTSPPAQTTSSVVAGGYQLTFTLSGGGNYGIAATPGFQGYIIASSQFQYCHAYAFISAQGALPTSAGANTGYIALEMDSPIGSRTGNTSEVLGH